MSRNRKREKSVLLKLQKALYMPNLRGILLSCTVIFKGKVGVDLY